MDEPLQNMVIEILKSALTAPLIPSTGLIVSRDKLQKPRLRVKAEMIEVQRKMKEDHDFSGASISLNEIRLAALVIAHAILNPYITEWDADRYLEKEYKNGANYFSTANFGYIDAPASILDLHGKVLAWYLPNIMTHTRVEYLNELQCPLDRHLITKAKSDVNKRYGHKHAPATDLKYGHGRISISPATFMLGHQQLEDPLYKSQSLKKPAIRQWLFNMTSVQEFWNSVTWTVLPDMARVGQEAYLASNGQAKSKDPIKWPSIYSAVDVIINQETPPHRDVNGAPSPLDLVVSLGSHNAVFQISDLNAEFAYPPGTMIFLAGKILEHKVPKWNEGERIALAHYMKDAVHNKSSIERPSFARQKDILQQFMKLA